jgi:hypothetical protein
MLSRQTRTPTSVLLPTVSWTDACNEVAAQLGPEDELLIIHDDGDDPVAGRERFPENVRLIRAGDPVGCSAKANAIDRGWWPARPTQPRNTRTQSLTGEPAQTLPGGDGCAHQHLNATTVDFCRAPQR